MINKTPLMYRLLHLQLYRPFIPDGFNANYGKVELLHSSATYSGTTIDVDWTKYRYILSFCIGDSSKVNPNYFPTDLFSIGSMFRNYCKWSGAENYYLRIDVTSNTRLTLYSNTLFEVYGVY